MSCTNSSSDKDVHALQQYFNSLEKWEEDWRMSFHPEKYQVIHICPNRRYRQRRQYTLHGHILESVDSAKHIGVHVCQDMRRIRPQSVQSAVYHQSFYPRTIREWNQLPTRITDIDDTEDSKLPYMIFSEVAPSSSRHN